MTEPARNLPTLSHLRRRTVLHLLRTWRDVKGTGRGARGEESLRRQMELCLDSPGGEISERAHTAQLGRNYLNLNEAGRLKFLKLLAADFDVDRKSIATLAKAYAEAAEAEKPKLEEQLRQALVAKRVTILKQFTALPDGFKFLVNMRADLLPLIGREAKLKGLEADLKSILAAWFDIGMLELAEITWNSPAALLEKIIEYEAVHRVASWDDLKNRLDSDRRVFAFFHPRMPLEPLIFVHVALVSGMSDSIQKLLDESAPPQDVAKADTAIFYSISNAQKGLAGISFGNFLIKRVVSELTQTLPHIKTFATLSPVPGFLGWLATSEHAKLLKELKGEWWKDAALKPQLMRLCAHYLVNEKKGGKPLDPVAAFHLFNGARLERLNWLGDTSPKGMTQSAGMMVNYHYKLDEIDENHEEFVEHGKIVAGRQVKGYL